VAAAKGKVEWTHDERRGNCCDVALLHRDGWRSRYIHLNDDTPGTDDGRAVGIAPGIRPGREVEAGELIGWVGNSGNAAGTGPHLHFELRRPDGVAIDPLESLLEAVGQEGPDSPVVFNRDPISDSSGEQGMGENKTTSEKKTDLAWKASLVGALFLGTLLLRAIAERKSRR
jgi:hypothetical protein